MIFSSWSQEATKRWMMRKIWSCRKLCYRFITLDLLVKAHRNLKNTRKLPDSWNKEITEQASFSSLYSNLSSSQKQAYISFWRVAAYGQNWATSGVSGCMSFFYRLAVITPLLNKYNVTTERTFGFQLKCHKPIRQWTKRVLCHFCQIQSLVSRFRSITCPEDKRRKKMDGERFTSNRKLSRSPIRGNQSQMTQAKTIGIALSWERPYIISETRSFNASDGWAVITFRFIAEICVYPGTHLDDIWFLLSLEWSARSKITQFPDKRRRVSIS